MARRRRRSRGPRFDFRDPLLDAPQKYVVDLHGLTAETAKARLQNELSTIRRRDTTTVVHIVTGKGNNSAGEPVLRGLVRRLLERDPPCAPPLFPRATPAD